MPTEYPSYMALHERGELTERASALEALLAPCVACPHECRVDRLKEEIARCYAGSLPIVSSYTLHHGEEPLLSGERGAGNIFFGNCNMRCVYCQNHLISQNWRVERSNTVTAERLAGIMLELQSRGAHNIGLVSPSHFVPQIVKALSIAAARGLKLPLIYNTNAYDSLEVLRLLDGIIDIYLPDIKYSDNEMGYRFSKVKDYPSIARAAIKEMHRQVGSDFIVGEDATLKRGIIVRHLVLPNDAAGSEASLQWIRNELGPDTALSIMAQYYPAHKASEIPLLSRKVGPREYERVVEAVEKLGFTNGWVQQSESAEYYCPDFENREEPFKRHT